MKELIINKLKCIWEALSDASDAKNSSSQKTDGLAVESNLIVFFDKDRNGDQIETGVIHAYYSKVLDESSLYIDSPLVYSNFVLKSGGSITLDALQFVLDSNVFGDTLPVDNDGMALRYGQIFFKTS